MTRYASPRDDVRAKPLTKTIFGADSSVQRFDQLKAVFPGISMSSGTTSGVSVRLSSRRRSMRRKFVGRHQARTSPLEARRQRNTSTFAALTG